MQAPPKPADEPTRLETLRALNVLDTLPEERFDRLTRMARRMFRVPIALVSLVDENRQWFKSCVGLDASETPRSVSFCGHAILQDDVLVIEDALEDERFADNPLVTGEPNIRFYAGYPLRVPNGSRLGTLCLIDVKPRRLEDEDLDLLRDLGRMAEQELAAVQLATLDELTQLSNRRGFETLAGHALGTCRRMGRPASLFYIDLNDFKPINDRFGHAEGDRALITFAGLLRNASRGSDVIARIGGDEFAVMMVDADQAGATALQDRLRQLIDEQNAREQRGYAIRCSIGTAHFDPDRHASVTDLMAEADRAMYAHKASSRGDAGAR